MSLMILEILIILVIMTLHVVSKVMDLVAIDPNKIIEIDVNIQSNDTTCGIQGEVVSNENNRNGSE